MKKIPTLLTALLLAAALLSSFGCDRLKGEDGLPGHNGVPGTEGDQGPQGDPGVLGLPCDKCIDAISIEDNSVINSKIADLAVGDTQLAPLSIGVNQLADGAIGTAQLANQAVTRDKIQDGAVTAGKIAAGAVGSANLGTGAVTAGTIACNAVGAANIAAGAVAPGNLAPGAVQSGNLAVNSVSSAAIAAGAVDIQHIVAGAVDHMWTVTRNNAIELTVKNTWVDMIDMAIPIDGTTTSAYLVMFEGTFYADGSNDSSVLRLVLKDGVNTTVLNRQSLSQSRTVSATTSCSQQLECCFIACSYSSWFTSCSNSHSHPSEQYMGSVSLHWAGTLAPNPNWAFAVQWYDGSGNRIWQSSDGDRTLSVIRFEKTPVN